MPLTKVKMFTSTGWQRIDATEAAEKFPTGIPADKKMFICELCGNAVTWARGEQNRPHFKHCSTDDPATKDCDEREQRATSYSAYTGSDEIRDLPLRLNIYDFTFDLGFRPVPDELLNKSKKIHIKFKSFEGIIIDDKGERDYSIESRICNDDITYLPVGRTPCENYSIELDPPCPELTRNYWPKSVEGVSLNGTLFECDKSNTCKKIRQGAVIFVGKEYYLLIPQRGINMLQKTRPQNIEITKRNTHNTLGWYIYTIKATTFDKAASDFFFNYHYRLEPAINIIPLWPVCIKKDDLLLHKDNGQLVIYLEGNVKLSVSPPQVLNNDGPIFSVHCQDQKQVLSASSTNLYLQKDENAFSEVTSQPTISVTDSNNNQLECGTQTKIPPKKQITIRTPFDGYVLQKSATGNLIHRYALKSEEEINIDNLQFGQSIEIYQGLDLVWQTHYVKPVTKNTYNDKQLCSQLESCNGEAINLPHSIGALATKMIAYPRTKTMLYRCIKNGKISQRAYKLLMHYFSTTKK